MSDTFLSSGQSLNTVTIGDGDSVYIGSGAAPRILNWRLVATNMSWQAVRPLGPLSAQAAFFLQQAEPTQHQPSSPEAQSTRAPRRYFMRRRCEPLSCTEMNKPPYQHVCKVFLLA
ncbi:hypothetical protein [Gluconobacter cerinus]|uniref:hypothetical protein n=1 Tax=Gluconobacter cerinus TaxID=38307 RepID=UPI002011761A|nr:hypothetical protein [Gluconobacter cerinus]